MRKKALIALLLLFIVVLNGVNCGGSKENDSVHRAVLKLSTTGTNTTIAAIDVTIQLPAGVTYFDAAPSDAVAATNPVIAINPNVPGLVIVGVITVAGFGTGEFITVNCDIAPGSMPSVDDFHILHFEALSSDGRTIDGLTSAISIEWIEATTV